MSGQAAARLYLTGVCDDVATLRGHGSLDVPSGKMYNLPLLLDLLKFLSLRLPDQVAFTEAHARFTILGRRVNVGRLDLFGDAISLGGRGTMNLDGSDINLDLYSVMGGPLMRKLELPLLKQIPPAISPNLLKIKVQGRLGGDIRFHKEFVPVLVEPLKEVLDRINGRK